MSPDSRSDQLPNQEQLTQAFCQSACEQLQQGLAKIDHCLDQLTDENVWQRPSESMNSIANLLLHLSGNVRQWLIAGISDVHDDRDRQSEFDDRSHRSVADLRSLLGETLDQSCDTIRRQTAEDLLRMRRVQEFDLNGIQTIHDSVAHFRGHVQEIIHMTRCQLGDRYQFDFIPQDQQEPRQ